MEGVTEQERNFRALLSQGYGAAPVAQVYASVGGTGVPPSLAFGGPQVLTPGPPQRQGNPSPQGVGRLNPIFHSPAAVTPVGAFQHTCICTTAKNATADRPGPMDVGLHGGSDGTRRVDLR